MDNQGCALVAGYLFKGFGSFAAQDLADWIDWRPLLGLGCRLHICTHTQFTHIFTHNFISQMKPYPFRSGLFGGILIFSGIVCAQPSLELALEASSEDPNISLVAGADNFEFGSAFSTAGDINQDGVFDIAVADRSARVNGEFASGIVYIISGSDGSILRTYAGIPARSQNFGFSMARLDSNGDGIDDLAIGAPGRADEIGYGAGAVTIFSGADGAILAEAAGSDGVQFGSVVVNAGDQNGDGLDDLFVGAPWADNFGGEVVTVSGADGSIMRRLGTDVPNTGFATAIVAVDDIDGDGRRDLAVSSPSYTGDAHFGVGRVQLVRSSDSSVVAEIQGIGFFNRLGSTLATAADADGDGVSDLLVGSFLNGTVLLVSGTDLSTVRDLSMTLPANRSIHVGGSIDYDGDGVDDWLIGSPGMGLNEAGLVVGGVRIISGVDKSILFERLANTTSFTGLGMQQVVLPDVGFAAGESRLYDPETGGYGAAHIWQLDLVLDSDGDGIPDDEDKNPNSNTDPTISILGVDTGVGNFVDGGGLTLADRFDGLGSPDDYANSTHYFTSVVQLTNQLVDQGLISGSDRKAINSAARDGAVKTKVKGGR